jgi:hypothetical protein
MRGCPTKEYENLYREWGKGGIGVIVLGNVPMDRNHPEGTFIALCGVSVRRSEAERSGFAISSAKLYHVSFDPTLFVFYNSIGSR